MRKFTTLAPLQKHQPAPTPKTVEKSAVVKPTPKPSLVNIFREKFAEKNSQAISTGMSEDNTSREITTGMSEKSTAREISTEISEERTSQATSLMITQKPKFVFKQRKGSEDNVFDEESSSDRKKSGTELREFDKDSAREQRDYLTRTDIRYSSIPSYTDNEFIDATTGTTVEFWTHLAIVSLVLALLLMILIILVNMYLVRKNCV